MKSWPDPASPWGRRVWYDDHEFPVQMNEALRRGGSNVFTPGTGVDVDAILELGYGVTTDYATTLPPEILGRTLFHRDGRIEVQISPALAATATTNVIGRRRLRSTLGHELGHVVLHSTLHPVDTTQNLFGEDEPPARVLCRDGSNEWWEHQAYRGMACVLIPATILTSVLPTVLKGRESLLAAVAAGEGNKVITALCDIFDTSFELTLYRLQDLQLLPSTTQRSLVASGT